MSDWPTVTLGDLFDIARGGSPRPIDDFITDDPDGINWIMIGDASEGSKYITSTRKRIRPEGAQRSRVVRPGDFLLTNSMSFGKPYIMGTSGCIHDGWLVLSPRRSNVHADFFYHLLGSHTVYAEFERRAAGATVKNLNIDLVRGVRIPLPPLNEQRRIAEILDKAAALRTKRSAALSQLDTLTQSIFLDMFGDPSTNPKGWPVKALTLVCDCYSGGTPSKANGEYWTGNLPWFSPKDLKQDDLFDSEDHVSEAVIAATGLRLLPPDTVVIVVRGMILAHTFPVSVLRVTATINQDLKALLPIAGLEVDSQFLAHCLRVQNHGALSYVSESAHGTKRLDSEALGRIRVLLPPIPAQRDFSQRVARVGEAKSTQTDSLHQIEALFESLQHRAFQGEL
jgi:type I restriction enzyme S subunit